MPLKNAETLEQAIEIIETETSKQKHRNRNRCSMTSAQVIIEMDIERDRKTCIAIDLEVTGANRKLAQWVAKTNILMWM